jgi:lysozyme
MKTIGTLLFASLIGVITNNTPYTTSIEIEYNHRSIKTNKKPSVDTMSSFFLEEEKRMVNANVPAVKAINAAYEEPRPKVYLPAYTNEKIAIKETSITVDSLIMKCEGFSATPHYCGGYAIGYGRAVYGKDIAYYRNNPLSKATALKMFKEDFEAKKIQVKELFKTVDLTENQIDALTSIAYNTGFYSFRKKALVAKILNGKSITENDFVNTIIPSYRKKYKGLIHRRKMEYKLYCQ